MVDEFEQLKTQIKDLEVENDCLKRDIRESSNLIKDYQEKDLEHQHSQRLQSDNERVANVELETKLKEI